jgi:hypothetical protein
MGEFEIPQFNALTPKTRKYINNLIYEAAQDTGLFLNVDDEGYGIYSTGEHGEIDITCEIVDFALNLLSTFIAIEESRAEKHTQ